MKTLKDFWNLPHSEIKRMIENHIYKLGNGSFNKQYGTINFNYDLKPIEFGFEEDLKTHRNVIATYFPHRMSVCNWIIQVVYIYDLLNMTQEELVHLALINMTEDVDCESSIPGQRAFTYTQVYEYIKDNGIGSWGGKTPANSVASRLSVLADEKVIGRISGFPGVKNNLFYLLD